MNYSQQFNIIRDHTHTICAPIKIEDYIPQPVHCVSPPNWHLAYSTWFFEQFILKDYLPGYEVFNKDFCFFLIAIIILLENASLGQTVGI